MQTAEKVQQFFEENPDATEVHEALGKLFSDKSIAEKYLKGVVGRAVTTHTPGGINFERVSDRLRQEVIEQENIVGQKQIDYYEALSINKEKAMGEWKAAQAKLAGLKSTYEKQLRMEEKDELLAKEEKPLSGDLIFNPTISELNTLISNQEIMVKEYKAIAKNPKLSKKKKNEAAVVIDEAVAKLDEYKKLLAEKEAEAAKGSEPKMVDHIVTEDDLTNNPELIEQGVKVGDTIQIPSPTENE